MPKFSDTQMVLLSAAAARADGALLPPPDGLAARGAALKRSVEALVRRGFAAAPRSAVRADDACSAVITDAGLRAIGIEPAEAEQEERIAAGTPDARGSSQGGVPNPEVPRGKLGRLIALMSGKHGATLDEMTVETGWQPHTTRAALTRLRQRGFAIRREDSGNRNAYHCGQGN